MYKRRHSQCMYERRHSQTSQCPSGITMYETETPRYVILCKVHVTGLRKFVCEITTLCNAMCEKAFFPIDRKSYALLRIVYSDCFAAGDVFNVAVFNVAGSAAVAQGKLTPVGSARSMLLPLLEST